jgi:hypothetical protein
MVAFEVVRVDHAAASCFALYGLDDDVCDRGWY